MVSERPGTFPWPRTRFLYVLAAATEPTSWRTFDEVPLTLRRSDNRVRGLQGLRRLLRASPVGKGYLIRGSLTFSLPTPRRESQTWEGRRMALRLIKAALMVGLAALVVQSLPDIRRYLKMRAM